jgi:hypothetical protein
LIRMIREAAGRCNWNKDCIEPLYSCGQWAKRLFAHNRFTYNKYGMIFHAKMLLQELQIPIK